MDFNYCNLVYPGFEKGKINADSKNFSKINSSRATYRKDGAVSGRLVEMSEINLEKREKRAKSIAAMGLVNREGQVFKVSTPSLRGKQVSYQVWRDEQGKVRCDCLEFEEQISQNIAFRCEHLLAVKFALLNKSTEQTAPVASTENIKTTNKIPPPTGKEWHTAVSLMDLVTARQLGMIRAVSRDLGIDCDEESSLMMDCKTDELSVKSASLFIEHLLELQKEQPVSAGY